MLLQIERKWLLRKNLATILLLKSKLSGEFQRFNAIDGSIEMLKISINMKNLKTFYESQTAICLKELFIPPQVKASYVSGKKVFERRFTKDFCFPSTPRIQFLGV